MFTKTQLGEDLEKMPSSATTESYRDNDPVNTIYHEQFAPPWRALLVIVFPIVPIFWNYRVAITKQKLTIGYSYCYSDIERNDILTATPIAHVNGLTEWGGWGLRYNLKWETGYIVKNGPAVRIEVRSGGSDGNGDADENASMKKKIYVFNTDEAEKVCDILNA